MGVGHGRGNGHKACGSSASRDENGRGSLYLSGARGVVRDSRSCLLMYMSGLGRCHRFPDERSWRTRAAAASIAEDRRKELALLDMVCRVGEKEDARPGRQQQAAEGGEGASRQPSPTHSQPSNMRALVLEGLEESYAKSEAFFMLSPKGRSPSPSGRLSSRSPSRRTTQR